nr:serine/arginine-rich splicing factor SR45-like [Anser cygnoides]
MATGGLPPRSRLGPRPPHGDWSKRLPLGVKTELRLAKGAVAQRRGGGAIGRLPARTTQPSRLRGGGSGPAGRVKGESRKMAAPPSSPRPAPSPDWSGGTGTRPLIGGGRCPSPSRARASGRSAPPPAAARRRLRRRRRGWCARPRRCRPPLLLRPRTPRPRRRRCQGCEQGPRPEQR